MSVKESVKDLLKKLSKELESKELESKELESKESKESESKELESKESESDSEPELEEISLPSVSSVAKYDNVSERVSERIDSDSDKDSLIQNWEDMQEDAPSMTGTPFIHDEKPYYYLSENNLDHIFLSQNSKIQIHLALYYISDNIKVLPFLSFMQRQNGSMYSFPGFEYVINHPNPEWNEQEDMESVMQDMFMNACIEHIFGLFEYKPRGSQSFSQYYKGYLKNESDCLVVFDCSFFKEKMFQSTPEYTWAILHELLNERKIEGIPVHPYVTEQLLNESLLYITDDKGIPIDIPYLLYGCENQISRKKRGGKEKEKEEKEEKEEKSIFDIFSTKPTSEPTSEPTPEPTTEPTSEPTTELRFKNIRKDSENTSFLLSRIEHPDYGYNYLFSSKKLDTTPVKRYVVFVMKTFYDILPKEDRLSKTGKTAVEEIYEDDIEITNEKNNQTYFSSFYFQESGVPFWMVKSVDFFMEF
jgi:hypothetical protein